MSKEFLHTPETDLDRTDKLPILNSALADYDDDDDDAGEIENTGVLAAQPAPGTAVVSSDFLRSSVDLPSLAESVRSVEERIARQNSEYELLTRAYDRAQETASSMAERANTLAADLQASRAALESEQARARELDKLLAERSGSVEAARSRIEEALREAERYQGESRLLRDSLAARDANIAQTLHSLGERDAQLAALRTEHAKIVPELEATSKSTAQLDAELRSVRARAETLATQLKASRETAATLSEQIKRGEAEVNTAQTELSAARTQAESYLELLRTREWRSGFDQNMFREMDAQVGAAQAGHGALESERDRLQSLVAELRLRLAAQDEAIGKLQASATENTATLAQQANELKKAEEIRARLAAQLSTTEAEVARLKAQLAMRERALAEALERGAVDTKKIADLLAAAERRQTERSAELDKMRTEHAAQMERFKAEADAREQEMTVLVAHLQEARRPIQIIEADVTRLTEELAAKNAAFEHLAEDNAKLKASLERTRGALEEREFLIRRLERSESMNANVLGRIQTSIERLGSVPAGQTAIAAAAAGADWTAELIRVDGERPVTHTLTRRTRIGRAAGCELQIESTSVSRHHALVLVGPRDAIIEDLNSTNGVLVNGRKITRQLLSDGDAVTIGDIRFRYAARVQNRALEAPAPAEPLTPA